MKRLIIFALLSLVWLVSRLHVIVVPEGIALDASALAALGFIVLGGHIIGGWLSTIGLPQVTGYMLTGIVAGPYLANILTQGMILRLDLVNKIALVLIAITAGGELRLAILNRLKKVIAGILLIQTLVILLLASTAFIVMQKFILDSMDLNTGQVLTIGFILAVMMTANSPSVAVAVINELKAGGRNTDLVMAVTVAKDALITVLFTIGMSLLYLTIKPAQPELQAANHSLTWIFTGSILIGITGGAILLVYLKYLRQQVEVAILVISIVMIQVVDVLHLELLLTAITTGFIVENLSGQGPVLMKGMKKISQPVYVVFFALSGAMIDIPLLAEIGIVALIWATIRIAGLWAGTTLGLKMTGYNSGKKNLIWLGFIPQAGVTLGMTVLVASSFPGWGETIRTLVLSIVAVNQVIGPVGLRFMLVKSGEAGTKG